jgi:hypothetical protein
MKLYMLIIFSITIPLFSLAQTVPQSSDATNPNMERYCDPAQNTDVMSKIKEYENKLKALSKDQEADRISILDKINKQTRKLKCTYRPIQD